MDNKAIKRLSIFLILIAPLGYFIAWKFIDIPPKVNPNIDDFKSMTRTSFSEEDIDKMWKAHHESSFFEQVCFRKYLKARDNAILDYCLENGLGEDTGGGCYHFVGSYNMNDTFHALNYCGTDWK